MLWEELLWAEVFCEDIVVWPNIFEARVTHKSANSSSFVIVINLLVNILVHEDCWPNLLDNRNWEIQFCSNLFMIVEHYWFIFDCNWFEANNAQLGKPSIRWVWKVSIETWLVFCCCWGLPCNTDNIGLRPHNTQLQGVGGQRGWFIFWPTPTQPNLFPRTILS